MTLTTRSARLELRLLGPLEIVGPDGTVRPAGEKPAAVLALLALHADEVVSRDRLVDALWDDEPPASAAASLQMHVSRARKLLDEAGAGRERLTTHGNGYVLHLETDELDALRFRALAPKGGASCTSATRHGRRCCSPRRSASGAAICSTAWPRSRSSRPSARASASSG